MTTRTPPTRAYPPTISPRDATTSPPRGPAHPRVETEVRAPVVLAVIVGAHGVGGQVRLKVFAEDLAAHRSFNDGAFTLASAAQGNNGLIVRFAEVGDRTQAEALRGTELTVPRSALPALGEGEYYHADLLGLPVVDTDGVAVGSIVGIDNFGAGDVIEIERRAIDDVPGRRFMVPMTVDAVPEWNAERLIVSRDFVD